MATLIQIRRGTAAQWQAVNPVLHEGEFGWETDTGILRIGDGFTSFVNITPIVTVGSVNELLEYAYNALYTERDNIIEAIDFEMETAINSINSAGSYYTETCQTIAGQLSGFQSLGAYMFNTVDGGDSNSVYNSTDVIDCGDSETELEERHLIDGDNATSSQVTALNIYVYVDGLEDLQRTIDSAFARIGVCETRITTINNTLNNINSTISTIQSSITALSNSISALADRVSDVETTIDGNTAVI